MSINLNPQVNIQQVYHDSVDALTHDGPFHADEVFATAILSFANDAPLELLRTRVKDYIADFRPGKGPIYDIGGVYDEVTLRFDHHQKGFEATRPNDTVRFSSAGLIWHHYGRTLLRKRLKDEGYLESVFSAIDRDLIRNIDAYDNGQVASDPFSLSAIIALINPNWHEDQSRRTEDERFLEAVAVAQFILSRSIEHAYAIAASRRVIFDAIIESQGSVLILPHYYDGWSETVAGATNFKKAANLLYGIYPSKNGLEWQIKCIPSDPDDKFSQRKPFPEAWRGLRDRDLAAVTGVETAKFCHAAGFIAAAGSKDDALRLAQLAATS